jgi:hypothetical protein
MSVQIHSSKRHDAMKESEQLWTYLSIDIRQKTYKSDEIMHCGARAAALPVPYRRYWRGRGRARAGFSLALRAAGNGKGKQAGGVADLKTCDHPGEFKERAQ